MIRALIAIGLIFCCVSAAPAESAPQWARLSPDQQQYLLEAFNIPDSQKGPFAEGIPNEVKQALLDTMWNVLTPEKRVQILLYAHLEKPFSQASNTTSQVTAPMWAQLTSIQKAKAYEAFKFDPTQKLFWDAMSPELRQVAFNTLWAYLPPEARRGIQAR